MASLLAADPKAAGIPRPAGVVVAGIVGLPMRTIVQYELLGQHAAQVREEFDVDGDGQLTAGEIRDGLLGRSAADRKAFAEILGDGKSVPRSLDTNRDGKINIDTELMPKFGSPDAFKNWPNVPGITDDDRQYFTDISRYGTVAQVPPRYTGSSLLLNGESDVQTLVRGAYVTDAALTAAHRDHTLHIYPGVGHGLNVTPKFSGEFGSPDVKVLHDLSDWLTTHAH